MPKNPHSLWIPEAEGSFCAWAWVPAGSSVLSGHNLKYFSLKNLHAALPGEALGIQLSPGGKPQAELFIRNQRGDILCQPVLMTVGHQAVMPVYTVFKIASGICGHKRGP